MGVQTLPGGGYLQTLCGTFAISDNYPFVSVANITAWTAKIYVYKYIYVVYIETLHLSKCDWYSCSHILIHDKNIASDISLECLAFCQQPKIARRPQFHIVKRYYSVHILDNPHFCLVQGSVFFMLFLKPTPSSKCCSNTVESSATISPDIKQTECLWWPHNKYSSWV